MQLICFKLDADLTLLSTLLLLERHQYHFCSQEQAEVCLQAMAIQEANEDCVLLRPSSLVQRSQSQKLLHHSVCSTSPTTL